MFPQVAVIIYAIFSLSKNPRLQGSLSPLGRKMLLFLWVLILVSRVLHRI